jgi:cytochrome c oxidase assembly protein subunit 15
MRSPRLSERAVTRLLLLSLIANTGIVVTGGAVRLTGSGLGCPDWPKCTDSSYVPRGETTGHTLVEFGNRTLTFVLTLAVLAAFLGALSSRRRPLVKLAGLALAGVPAQAVVGGITVRTHLNPYWVAGHFLLSIAVIAVCVLAWWRSRLPDTAPVPVVGPLRTLGWLMTGAAALVIVLGTLVTGSGPHAGDRRARRTGFDPAAISQLHADAVMLLVGLTVATLVAFHAGRVPARVRRAAWALFGVELSQAAIGYTQYFPHLPVVLVGLHLLGACLVWIATLRVLLLQYDRPAASEPVPSNRSNLVGLAT